MHMADALVSPAVGVTMLVLSGGALAWSAKKTAMEEDALSGKRVPLMGVMSAFVFAAQMINFTIPGTGSSGHIGGGILLCAVLGSCPGFLSITAVLLIQALFFADGGLLALGCNVWNMGFYTCFVAYPLIFLPLIRKKRTPARLTLASVLAAVAGLQLGAFSVVLETLLSGVADLPFSAFVTLMQPIHLAIGLVEGLITGAVLTFVYKARPELIRGAPGADGPGKAAVSLKTVLAVLAITAALIGGGLSLVASARPDGLEWAVAGVTGGAELKAPEDSAHRNAAKLQASTGVLPDYALPGSDSPGGTSLAGLVGGALLIALAGGGYWLIGRIKRRKHRKEASLP